MDNATKCQTHSEGLHYGREHIEREIYNEKGYSIGAELFEEIVRCKDCKHNNNTCRNHGKMEPSCDFTRKKLKEMDFCSYGERSEE